MNIISLVVTVIGNDRPGLVDSVARVVAEHGANWVESRMAHLAGQFAGILRVEVAGDKSEDLTAALKSLDRQGVEVVIHADADVHAEGDDATGDDATDVALVHLELIGQDRPGIVREIASVLAEAGVNVEDFSTECVTAATTGQRLFQAAAELRLPAGVSEAALRSSLEQLATDLMVDIDLRAATERAPRV